MKIIIDGLDVKSLSDEQIRYIFYHLNIRRRADISVSLIHTEDVDAFISTIRRLS